MKKLYNVIFPIWIILLVPPIVLIVIPSNFIIDSLVLIIGFKILKLTKWFNKYKKSILRIWIVGFIVDIFGSLLLLATQFFGENEYLYQTLVYPLAWNPFESIMALLYALIVVMACGVLIYVINYKFSFNKADLDNRSKKIISLLLGIVTSPYLFLVPTEYIYNANNNYVSLNKYQNSYIGDNSTVGNIINNIYSGNYMENFSLDTNELPYGVTINYKEGDYVDVYKHLEQDALILFKLVQNIDYVEFKINDKIYSFDNDYVKAIYENINEVELDDIYSRYKRSDFLKFTYLGHASEYDLFDTSTTCGIDKTEIYSDDNYIYLIECADINALYLVNNDTKIKLKTALEKNKVIIDDVFKTNVKITKQNKNEMDT